MWNPFRKKIEEISRTNPGFEETEKRTPKAGILLLIIMFIAGMFFGWSALDDLARIPSKPTALSNCSYSFRSAYVRGEIVSSYESPTLYEEYPDYKTKSYDPYQNCLFNEIEKENSIPELFEKRQPVQKEITSLNNELNQVNRETGQVQPLIDQRAKEYDLGLQELQARIQDPAFPADAAQRESIKQLLTQHKALLEKRAELSSRLNSLQQEIKSIDNEIKEAYKPVLKEYNRQLRWYDFKVFALQFIFVLPFFWIVFALYLKQYRKNSPYAVIYLGILGVASVLLLRVILVWFWGLFLQSVLETIFRWLAEFELLRSIVFYGGMLLSFAVFGGAVYYLQKKIFDPRRIMLRRFRSRQCPHCQTDLNLSHLYCPNCGHQVREKCPQCGQDRFVNLPTCPHCGLHKEL